VGGGRRIAWQSDVRGREAFYPRGAPWSPYSMTQAPKSGAPKGARHVRTSAVGEWIVACTHHVPCRARETH